MECKCDMRTKLVGDGCEVCNPALALDHAKERIAELEAALKNIADPLAFHTMQEVRLIAKSVL